MHHGTLAFWGLIASLGAIIILSVIVAILIQVDLAILIATAIAAIAYPIVVLRERYVLTPELEILFDAQNEPDLYRPSLTLIDLPSGRPRNIRIEIRIVVDNKGNKTADSCVGEIQLVKRPNGCEAFSSEPKVLQWTRSTEPIRILPKQKATLDVVFSELRLCISFQDASE